MVRDRDAGLSTIVEFPTGLPAPSAGVDAAEIGVDYVRLLYALRRRWAPAILLGLLLGLALAVPVWVFYPRSYEAVSWLRVRDKGGMLSRGRDSYELEAYKKTNLSLMKSSNVLQGALRRPGIESLPTLREAGADQVGWISRKLQIVAPADSEIVQVKLRGKNPEDVSQIVNAVVTSFLDDVVNKERTERLSRRDAMEKKFKENQAELRTRRDTVNSLAKTLGTRDSQEVATQRSLLMEHLSSVRYDLNAANRDIAVIDAELEMAEARETGEISPEELPEELVDAALAKDPQIRELRDRLLSLEEAIAFQEQRSVRRAGEPAVRRLRSQAEEMRQTLERFRRQLRPAIVSELMLDQIDRDRRRESPAVLRKRRELLCVKLETQSKEFDQLSKEVTDLGRANADLDNRKNELTHLEQVTNAIGMELEGSAIDLNMPNRVTLVEQAGVPQVSDTVFQLLITLLSGIGGFAVGGGLIVMIEYLRNLVYSPDDLPRRIGVRVLGTFPLLSKLRKRPDYGAVTAECGDTIRTVIQSGRDIPKVILVTSAVEHEGKTTFATQLAASLARAGNRTLLIDGDLRHPHAHLPLELELRAGFPELLRGEMGNDEAVQPTSIDGLFAVTGGSCDYAAITALSKADLGDIIGHYRGAFDHVVIDAGPVLAFADALLLGQKCDALILATMLEVSSVTLVNKAVDRLQSVGVRLLGTVVNGGASAAPSRRYASPLPV